MDRSQLETWIPGIRVVRAYQRAWLRSDLVAGISVAAVAVPIGIAYAQLAGAPPAVGLYSCILPPVAYAIFGSSRQLIVNPDSAACTVVAATLLPLAANDPSRYTDLTVVLSMLVGLFCVVAGLARFGFVANFLSRPILTGYLNGIALSIIAGQLGTLLGFKVPSAGFFRTIAYVFAHLSQTHVFTLAVGLSLFLVLRALRYLAPKIPAPLVAAAIGIATAFFLRLGERGVAIVGTIPNGFPVPHIPSVSASELAPLAIGACTIVLVSFCSMMTTARGFAAKNGYSIDPNRDFIALGASDLVSALSQGFAVSGADSRTAVADSAGGKTQVTSLFAAATMALILFFLTAPLAYLPKTALAAILISAALGLFDIASLRRYYRLSPPEFRFSVVATLGVMTVGVLPGMMIAVALALLKLLLLASRPQDAILGLIDEKGYAYGTTNEGARTIPGLLIYRFDSALLFFNADYFKDRALSFVDHAGTKPEWFLFDAESVNLVDVTGVDVLEELRAELAARNIVFAIARSKGRLLAALDRTEFATRIGRDFIFPTVHTAAQEFLRRHKTGEQGA